MYDEDLAVFKTNHPVIKLGMTLPFDEETGGTLDLYVTKLESVPQRHTIVTMSETMDG